MREEGGGRGGRVGSGRRRNLFLSAQGDSRGRARARMEADCIPDCDLPDVTAVCITAAALEQRYIRTWTSDILIYPLARGGSPVRRFAWLAKRGKASRRHRRRHAETIRASAVISSDRLCYS